jgi:hypothetical protein
VLAGVRDLDGEVSDGDPWRAEVEGCLYESGGHFVDQVLFVGCFYVVKGVFVKC